MRVRSTDRLIALQFLAVVAPVAAVLLLQMVADARRAASLEHSRPLRILAQQARANYKTFTNGAADAVDSGALGAQSADALRTAQSQLTELAGLGQAAVTGEAPAELASLAGKVTAPMPIALLMPLREKIMQGDQLTRQIDQEFARRDEAVVKEAIDSAVTQQRQVIGALLASVVLSLIFVLEARRRLKATVDAEAAVERQRRAELETISIRFGLATQAARAGVYEVHEGLETLWWSDSMYALYGQTKGEFTPTVTAWTALVHPDDRATAYDALLEALATRGQLRTRYRATRADGQICHIESLAAVIVDSATSRSRLVGIDLDISDRVAAEQRERDLQEQLRDASRSAGMAEVATNVLHNIGNVLNSVNVSASLVVDRLNAPRIGALGRVAGLLHEHRADLVTFMSADDRGRKLPEYLLQLSEHLQSEQRLAIGELESLRKNIDHIKDIVTMQQRYAKLAGVAETVDVRTLVDDSLRLNTSSAERCAVSYERELAQVPPIVVDKHKVLQILVNLVRNAKQACEAAGRVGGRVLVRVGERADGIAISVSDDGVGIPAENMTRIFSHGFTTKKNGHGFGLHGGALAARELGGHLRVASDGAGRGATFTLELPLQPPGAAHAG